MREEEGVVGDEEGRTETPSSTIPPDHLRCRRSSGMGWRCKGWKFHTGAYCEKHYNQRRLKQRGNNKVTTMDNQYQHQVIEKTRVWKRRRYTHFIVSEEEDDEEDNENIILSKKNTKALDNKGMEKYNISELITYLKSSFRKQEFENVEKMLQMREDNIKMEKEEAENRIAQFKQELGIIETTCEQLTSEVEEKKKDILEVKDNIAEMEIKNFNIQDEFERCSRKKDDLEGKVGRLEKEVEIVRERERISEERFTKLSWDLREKLRELERKNRDLEASKRRAEGGIEVSKERFEQSETQVLLEPQASRKICGEPRGSQSLFSCLEKGKDNESEKWRLEGVIGKEATEHDRGFYAPANSDSISQSLTRARVPDEVKKCENKQTKTQNESSCSLTGACSPNLKEALNCGGRIYVSTKADLDCCTPCEETRVAQLAGVTKKSESKQILFQNEATHALEGEEVLNCDEKLCTSPELDSIYNSARGRNSQESPLSTQSLVSPLVSEERKLSERRRARFPPEASRALNGSKSFQVKIKEGAWNWEGRLYTSASGDSIHHSARGENTKESAPSSQRFISLQQSKKNGSTETKFQNEDSCALNGVKLSQVKIKEEPLNCDERISASASVNSAGHSIRSNNVKDASTSRSKSILLQQFEQERSTAEQMLSNQFEIIGTSCKQSRNSTAKNDSEKEAKELGADRDGISAFLHELRKLKANKLNLTLKHT